MATTPAPGNDLRDLYAAESARIRDEFSAKGDGRAAVHGRTALVDSIALASMEGTDFVRTQRALTILRWWRSEDLAAAGFFHIQISTFSFCTRAAEPSEI